MYCPDTLKRINNEEVAKHRAKLNPTAAKCEYCGSLATKVIPVFNPADAVRGVEGAYCTIEICDDCYENSEHMNDGEYFNCTDCGELFIVNHSWDSLVCTIDDEQYCHKCAADHIEPKILSNICKDLADGKVGSWNRINTIPKKKKLWEGEFSSYSDFPGYTSTQKLSEAIQEAAVEASGEGEEWPDDLYPIISQNYQFSVVLAIYG